MAYNINEFSEDIIDIAITSVLANQNSPSLEEALRTIFSDGIVDEENQYLKRINSFFDIDRFWNHMEKNYGYREDKGSLKQLLIHLMLNALSTTIIEEKLDVFKHFITQVGKTNCAIFIDRWMNHKSDYKVYDTYAKDIEEEIIFSKVLQSLDIDDIKNLDIFPSIDQAIILYISNALKDNLEDYDEYLKILRLRKSKHFYEKYKCIYEGLYNAIKIFEFKKLYSSIPMDLPQDMVKSYVDRYYLMDFYYRKFYIAFDKDSNNQVLQELKSMVEGIYTNWFMMNLSYNWSESISKCMKDIWHIHNIVAQKDCYDNFIKPRVSQNERVFLIVSDALRYEVGAELCDRLDGDSLGSTKLIPLIAGLPTNTKFGMARLLPHENIELKNNGFIHVDRINSGSMEGRKQILLNQISESTAINYNDYMSMDRESLREFYKGNILNYIYHNSIDAIGDDFSTEIKAFNSAEVALDELIKLVNSLRGNLSATNIYITSDHGFIYQRDRLEEVDKIAKENIKSIESKRRYILSEETINLDGLLKFSMKDTLGEESNLSVYILRANIRFKTQGAGANFVHGGASLQEIVVPLILYKNKVLGQTGAIKPEKTQIKLTNTTRRIANSIFTLNFFQTEKVGGKIIPCTVRVYMVDDQDKIISNEEILLGDKKSENPEDRTMDIRFILKSLDYDRDKDYYLIIEDLKTGVEYEKIQFTINLGINI